MRLNELYESNLNEAGVAYNTARAIAHELHGDLSDLLAIRQSAGAIEKVPGEFVSRLQNSIRDNILELEHLGYEFDWKAQDHLRPLTVDMQQPDQRIGETDQQPPARQPVRPSTPPPPVKKRPATPFGPGQQGVAEGLEDYEGLKIKFSKDSDGVAVKALSDDGNRVLASVELFFNEKGQLEPQDLWTNDRFQGQGIAKAMYDFLKNKGYTIIRSWDQTDAGKGFWDKHKGAGVNVWEQGAAEAGSPAQQAAIAIAMKKAHKKPKSEGMEEAKYGRPSGRSSWDSNMPGYTGGFGDRDNKAGFEMDAEEWFKVFDDGKLYKISIFPTQRRAAEAEGYSPTREQARARAGQGNVKEEKIKGVDGKACWPGKRYAGKKKKPDGTYKDICVPVKGK